MEKWLRAIIDRKYDRCVAVVVRRLCRTSCDFIEDVFPARNVWDLWKLEMQEEHSFFYGAIEADIETHVRYVVRELRHEDGVLMTLGASSYEGDLDGEEPSFSPEDVVQEVMSRLSTCACDRKHRPSVQAVLDDRDLARFEEDTEYDRLDPEIEQPIPCPKCLGAEPTEAKARLLKEPREVIIADDHFSMSLRTCSQCGQSFLCVFSELVDWSNGDDSQAQHYIPISAEEAAAFRVAGEQGAEKLLHNTKLERMHLLSTYPRGKDLSVEWRDGIVFLLPHD
jgi:hypothetical protein